MEDTTYPGAVRKQLIADAYVDAILAGPTGTLAEFKADLLTALRNGTVVLARCDMPAVYVTEEDIANLADSETVHPLTGARFHYLVHAG